MRCLCIILVCLLFFSCNDTRKTTTGFAEVNGTKLYYEVAGKGEPILFVHGNVGDCRHWDYQFKPLSKKYKVVRYDVRGYGKSDLPNPEITFSNHVDIYELMNYLDIEKVHICGFSMGSSIATSFAIAYPDKCLSLISVGSWVSGYGFGDYKSLSADSMYAVMNKVRTIAKENGSVAATDFFINGNELFRKTLGVNQQTMDFMKSIGYDYSYWGFINEYKTKGVRPVAVKQLSNIKIPTLIITAEFDLGACSEVADLKEAEIEGSKKITIQNAGHVMNVDKPDEFNSEIISFIGSLK